MGLFDKLFGGLGKTRQQIDLEELFQGYAPDSEDFYENLEEMLILSDAGMETAERVDYLMRRKTWEDRYRKGEEAREGLIKILTGLLDVGDTELKLTTKPPSENSHTSSLIPAKRSCSARVIPSAPRRRSSSASGRSARARILSATRREATPRPSSMTAFAQPKRAAPT